MLFSSVEMCEKKEGYTMLAFAMMSKHPSLRARKRNLCDDWKMNVANGVCLSSKSLLANLFLLLFEISISFYFLQ